MLARSIQQAMGGVNPPDLAQYGKAIVFDPQDLRTLYQDSAGTIPVTGVEQPVGLMLDKGQGLELGPELVTNGTFDTDISGWVASGSGTISHDSTNYRINVAGTGAGAAIQASTPINIIAERSYRVTGTLVTGLGASTLTIRNSSDSLTSSVIATLFAVAVPTNDYAYNGVFTATTNGTVYLALRHASVGATRTWDNISVRELKGHHATQSTAGSRPTLSARYNMLVGTNTLATQSVTTLATDYTLSFSGTGTVTLSGTAPGANSAGVSIFTATAGTLTLTVSGTVTNAQLVASNQSSLPYQSVTSATVYDSDPSKFPWYLRFTDHWMVTPSIDATAWDKVVVACGLRKMSDAASGYVLEFSQSLTANNGSFLLGAPANVGTTPVNGQAKGTIARSVSVTGKYLAPSSFIATLLASISAPITSLRINSVVEHTITSALGIGTLSNYPLYIGKRAGTSLAFNGYLYGLTVLFPTALPNDNIIQALERHYAAKSGIRL